MGTATPACRAACWGSGTVRVRDGGRGDKATTEGGGKLRGTLRRSRVSLSPGGDPREARVVSKTQKLSCLKGGRAGVPAATQPSAEKRTLWICRWDVPGDLA